MDSSWKIGKPIMLVLLLLQQALPVACWPLSRKVAACQHGNAACCTAEVWQHGINNSGNFRNISSLVFLHGDWKTPAFYLDFRPLAFFLQSRIGPGVISKSSSVSMRPRKSSMDIAAAPAARLTDGPPMSIDDFLGLMETDELL